MGHAVYGIAYVLYFARLFVSRSKMFVIFNWGCSLPFDLIFDKEHFYDIFLAFLFPSLCTQELFEFLSENLYISFIFIVRDFKNFRAFYFFYKTILWIVIPFNMMFHWLITSRGTLFTTSCAPLCFIFNVECFTMSLLRWESGTKFTFYSILRVVQE